jgi:hypothetical protein
MATMKGKTIAFVTAIATKLEERTVLSLFLSKLDMEDYCICRFF